MRVGDVRLRHLTDISRQPEHVRLEGRSGPSPSDDATSAHARGRHELWSEDLMRLSTFSARVETATKPFFREAFKRTRCLIPASGY